MTNEFYNGYYIHKWISPKTKKTLLVAMPQLTNWLCVPVAEKELLKELIDEAMGVSKKDTKGSRT